jgi:hypothetical protein
LNNNTAGVREREDANRTRVAGHLDEIQGDVAAALGLLRSGAVGFIDWLDAAAQGAMDEAPALGEVVPSVWASDLVLMLP